MKKFNDKIQELLNSILKKSPSNENDINIIDEISDDAYIDDVFAETAAIGHTKVTFDDSSLRYNL